MMTIGALTTCSERGDDSERSQEAMKPSKAQEFVVVKVMLLSLAKFSYYCYGYYYHSYCHYFEYSFHSLYA